LVTPNIGQLDKKIYLLKMSKNDECNF